MKKVIYVAALAEMVGALSSFGHEVSFGGGEFLVDGKVVQIRAGELEPQRIPREYWRHRIRMCKAMGLNAISSYFMWNDFERPDGSFDFSTGNRDVAAFMALCKEEGVWLLFRPGPYICGEWDFGGIPARLLKEDVAVRSMDPRYLSEAEKYLSAIADIAKPFLAKNGGPILLTQIEIVSRHSAVSTVIFPVETESSIISAQTFSKQMFPVLVRIFRRPSADAL